MVFRRGPSLVQRLYAVIDVPTFGSVRSSCILSNDSKHRYQLTRHWGLVDEKGECGPWVTFIATNPSTATHDVQDNTIRKCMKFARSWGYAGLVMANVFTYRATDPADMLAQGAGANDPYADRMLIDACSTSALIVAAWGEPGSHLGRSAQVIKLLIEAEFKVYALALNKSGEPGHPLYLKDELKPFPWMTPISTQKAQP